MDNICKITADRLTEISEEYNVKTIDWRGMPLTVRTFIPFNEMREFIISVISDSYDNKNGVRVWEIPDFAFRANVILRYTYAELPKDIEKQYAVLYNTDLYDCVIEAVNGSQIKSIQDAIMKYIK